jgi:glucose/arabinose dehydrogenase
MLRQFVAAVVCLSAVCSVAPAADMQYPLAIAAIDNGPIFIVDRNLPGVWRFADGKLETYYEGSKKFRTPLNAPRCAAIDLQGRLLVGDSATREIYRFNADGKPEPLTKGVNNGIGTPMALTVNKQGVIFVCDLERQWIFKVPADGGAAEEFVQAGPCRGITIDDQDRLWVVSHGKNQILRITPDAKIEVVLDKWPFQFPHHIVVDKELNAYVADGYGKAIWKIDPAGKPTKLAEGPPLDNPVGIAWQGDKLLVVDPRANSVFEVARDGKLTTAVSSPLPKPPAPPAKVEKPAAKDDKKAEKKDK